MNTQKPGSPRWARPVPARATDTPVAATRSASGRVLRLPENKLGRDFVVGDIHGTFDFLVNCLRSVKFDKARDRLFSVGDTVDRGPGSPRARAFLSQPYVYAVSGNHEQMFLEIYDEMPDIEEDILRVVTRDNGMSWWMDLGLEERAALIAEFRKLPLAIEVQTRRGTVGLVHAEVPAGMDWATFLEKVEAGERKLMQQAVWGRNRVQHRDEAGVRGVGRVFVGHTPVRRPTRLGNVYYIDTGAVFGQLNDDPGQGRMTFANLMERSAVLSAPEPADDFLDIRAGSEDPSVPFGAYAR